MLRCRRGRRKMLVSVRVMGVKRGWSGRSTLGAWVDAQRLSDEVDRAILLGCCVERGIGGVSTGGDAHGECEVVGDTGSAWLCDEW